MSILIKGTPTNFKTSLESVKEKAIAEKNKANLTARITKEEISRSGTSRIYRKHFLVIENKGLAEAIIAKQRNGPVGSLKLMFIKEFARFENLTQTMESVQE